LPIARGIIEAHGGSIWAESPGFDEEKCPGSTLHLLLPIHKEIPTAPADQGVADELQLGT
jgi:signal transduction histidine kinase